MPEDWSQDPAVVELREQISAADRELLALVNRRIRLVDELREHKERNGYPFVDAQREANVIEALERLNTGPLSAEGLGELFRLVIDLGKREVTAERRPGGAAP
jgi:chorismate mutase / prephenate dehydratase